jgi:hypothetical protein
MFNLEANSCKKPSLTKVRRSNEIEIEFSGLWVSLPTIKAFRKTRLVRTVVASLR